ncbi:MAG: hypothetical protein NC254_13850 [bacterium]|nr:hypothetical protein [bacterium]
MRRYRVFLGILAAVIASGAVMIAALVITVDPFFQYHEPVEGFAYVIDDQLSQNPGLAKNTEYDAVLLGSSVTVNFNTAWFEELFGVSLVKLPYNGAYPRDIVNAMGLAEKSANTIDMVFWGLDVSSCSGGTEQIKYELPSYLYDDFIGNDVYYWYNKDVLLDYILKPFLDPSQGTDRTDYYSTWQLFGYNKWVALNSYHPVPRSDQEYADDFLLDAVKENMDVNICPMIERHPETQFYIFFPPYSILYWYDFERLRQTDAILTNEAYIMECLLDHDNVRVFFFHDDYEITADLENYTDRIHYSREVSRHIAEAMADGRGEVHKDDYEEILENFREYVHTYDYDSIWDDYEHMRPED